MSANPESLPSEAQPSPDFGVFVDQSICPIMALDRTFCIAYANDAYLDAMKRTRADLLGKSYFEAFPMDPECEQEAVEKFNKVLAGKTARLEVQPLQHSGPDGCHSPRHWHAMMEAQRNESGEVEFIVQRAQDVSEQVRLQRSNDVLAAELDHRVKNLISVILATARISGATAESVEQYTEEFCNRLESMTRNYDLLSANGWRGVSLRSMLEQEISHAIGRSSNRYSLRGSDFTLTLKGSKDGGLIIHEMVANAVKFGCFSRPEGRLDVEWDVVDEMLRVVWTESGMTGISAPIKEGFGTKILSIFPNARIRQEFRDSGMRLEVLVPADLVIDGYRPARSGAAA